MVEVNLKNENIPLSEYPRPQFVRDSYVCLNGEWDFEINNAGEPMPETYQKKIIVPFSPETKASRLNEKIIVKPSDRLYYKRSFVIDKNWLSGIIYLHFGAVDYSADVFINNKHAGHHEGGYTSFKINISPFVKEGDNTVIVVVSDATEKSGGGRGKQKLDNSGIWLKPQSGIWQTVWMENVPLNHILDIKYTPDIINNQMKIFINFNGVKKYWVYDGDDVILHGETQDDNIILNYDFELWSPEKPKLYNIEFQCDEDNIKSYFAMRSCSIEKDENGKEYLCLNNKPYFFSGVIDQGYWTDGLMTALTDKDIVSGLNEIKNMGFNTIRKYVKIEPLRWYYHCDRLGLIVWQDFVNGGGVYKFSHIVTFPFFGIKHQDDDYKYFSRSDEKSRKRFTREWQETVEQLKNCPCIYMWSIFNEGWGQFDSKKIERAVKITDTTRVVESASGWYDNQNECDIKSIHCYKISRKFNFKKEKRPITLSEFGGISLKINENKLDNYIDEVSKEYKRLEKYQLKFKNLYENKIISLIKSGLNGCIYTQISDVEEEYNGIFTYDRNFIKIPTDLLKEINNNLYSTFDSLDIKLIDEK